ncbi:LptA/OstA family protein [Temperatibacter marinus]|uniref:LptA/OstA family protein n=1 Tax=Temperatibacter marinus TaxID=1456591 RepID=A0AA52HA91_9PROT|nr:LptA/OstA family protein [Temperatibacter marinus]WND03729.1 LptA/OstA family protein [Temperatibacter marinus]
MKYITAAIALLLSIGLMSGPSSVTAQSSLKGHDTEQPFDVTADTLEVRQKEGWALFKGLVQVTQGGLLMKADEIRVFYDKESLEDNPEINRLDAKGRIQFTSASESIAAERAIYDVEKRLVTMLGNIVIKRGESVLQGSRLELDLVSGLTKLDGQANDQKGRVKGTFKLPESDQKQK